METSVLIARLLAAIYISIGVGVLINSSYYRDAFDKMMKDSSLYYMGGFMALTMGVLIVSFHNHWVQSWEVVITILGWAAVVKGVFLFIAPKQMMSWGRVWLKNMPLLGVIVLLLGLFFGYFGFIATGMEAVV